MSDFKIEILPIPRHLERYPDLRLTVDHPEDLVVCREVYSQLKDYAPKIPLDKIIKFMDSRPDLAELVRPRHPVPTVPIRGWDAAAVMPVAGDLTEVSTLIADVDPSHTGIPVLFRQYMKLGARLLGFNIDPDFSHVIDGLMVIDATQADPRALGHYMGKDGVAAYLAHHGK